MSSRCCYSCGCLGHLSRQCPWPPLPASPEPMGEEDHPDCDYKEDVASEITVDNLELLYEMLQTTLRGELGLVGSVVERSVVAVKDLASAVRETQLEMRG